MADRRGAGVAKPHDPASGTASRPQGVRGAYQAVVGVIGTVVGLAPHVLHHVSLLAGTALIAGAGGTAVFAVLGFAASIPFLLRLRRRFNSWWAPFIGLAVFAAMFSVSAFVIGPLISAPSEPPPQEPSTPSATPTEHHS